MRTRLRVFSEWIGRVGIAFLALATASLLIRFVAPQSVWLLVIDVGLAISGIWLAARVLRRAALWRLRNRLLVTYLFIAVVPILLIIALAVGGGEYMTRQLAMYLVSSELDRRIDGLADAAQSVIRTRSADRPAVIKAMIDLFYEDRYPGIEILLRDADRMIRYPATSTLPPPRDGWPNTGVRCFGINDSTSGVIQKRTPATLPSPLR